MGTVIRTTTKGEYSLPKHRYLELYHFCLQYPDFKKEYAELEARLGGSIVKASGERKETDETARIAMRLSELRTYIELIEAVAYDTDKEMGSYILDAVTKGRSYETMVLRSQIPICRVGYYKLYRRFFHKLSRKK